MYTYSVKNAKKMMADSIRVYLEKNENGYVMEEVNRLPFYLVGAPGIGKTQMASQVAEELGIGFASCSITHHSRNTVLGLPVISDVNVEGETQKYTEYTMSEIIGKVYEEVSKGHKEGILLIDEFACMADSLVAPMLAFLQTKNISSHTLPEGWVLILASNPPEYNKNARTFDTAIMDRVRLINIEFDAEEFIQYAIDKNFNGAVVEFLKLNKRAVYEVNMGKGDTSIVTTRGWENLSHTLEGLEKMGVKPNEAFVYQFIKSERLAKEFIKFYMAGENSNRRAMLADILVGKNHDKIAKECQSRKSGEQANLIIGLGSLLQNECSEHKDSLTLIHKMDDFYNFLNTQDNNPFMTVGNEETYLNLLERRRNNQLALSPNPFGNMTFTPVPVNNGTDKVTEEEKKAIDEIILIYKSKIAMGEMAGNELVIASFDEWKNDEKRKLEEKETTENTRISNAIKFVQSLSSTNNYLLEDFISILNGDLGILEVISRCKNKEYIEVSRKLKALRKVC